MAPKVVTIFLRPSNAIRFSALLMVALLILQSIWLLSPVDAAR